MESESGFMDQNEGVDQSQQNYLMEFSSETCEALASQFSQQMHALATELFPICRSITGNGVRKTLNRIKEELPDLKIFEVPSGTKVFDWNVPNEWNLKEAYIIDPEGNKICDTNVNNLHVLNYSIPIHKEMDLNELKEHLYTLEDQPDAIPYITSYYKERWGFCLTHRQFEKLVPGQYTVHIGTTLEPGHLTYAELKIPGEEEKEIFYSTYVCHPSMANNELSGPMLVTYLAKWLKSLSKRKYSYRIVFIPETIGSITYISRNLDELRSKVLAGFNVSCVGDERTYSYLPSRNGKGLSDRVIQHVLKHTEPEYKKYSYQERASDERQYCAPGVDLKMASLMRSKYRSYPEYHTSKDDLNFVTPKGLGDCLLAYMRCVSIIENNNFYMATHLCEPQMGKRGLFPTLSNNFYPEDTMRMMDILAYSDAQTSLMEISEIMDVPVWELFPLLKTLLDHDLIKKVEKNDE